MVISGPLATAGSIFSFDKVNGIKIPVRFAIIIAISILKLIIPETFKANG